MIDKLPLAAGGHRALRHVKRAFRKVAAESALRTLRIINHLMPIDLHSNMPAAVKHPRRVLGDATKVYNNLQSSPNPAKKRKLDDGGKLGSSQPKSQFEEEVLEKLTQDISGLKKNNLEKDQQWERPSLNDFDKDHDDLCFQQIEAEEGTLHGGRTCVKLFGVTEVWKSLKLICLAPVK
ncbi:MAG: hypothetical protein Q9177_005136 [Variospora cf. flavescens]